MEFVRSDTQMFWLWCTLPWHLPSFIMASIIPSVSKLVLNMNWPINDVIFYLMFVTCTLNLCSSLGNSGCLIQFYSWKRAKTFRKWRCKYHLTNMHIHTNVHSRPYWTSSMLTSAKWDRFIFPAVLMWQTVSGRRFRSIVHFSYPWLTVVYSSLRNLSSSGWWSYKHGFLSTHGYESFRFYATHLFSSNRQIHVVHFKYYLFFRPEKYRDWICCTIRSRIHYPRTPVRSQNECIYCHLWYTCQQNNVHCPRENMCSARSGWFTWALVKRAGN